MLILMVYRWVHCHGMELCKYVCVSLPGAVWCECQAGIAWMLTEEGEC